MKTKLLVLFLVLFIAISHAQVGIGTTTPKSILDISTADPNSPEVTDGILIPRLNVLPTTDPGEDQDGMLIYLTTDASGYFEGFHYWDNSVLDWIPMRNEWTRAVNSDGEAYIRSNIAYENGFQINFGENGDFGIGTNNPIEHIELRRAGDNDMQFTSANTNPPNLIFYNTGGTLDSPDLTAANQEIGSMIFKTHDGVAVREIGGMRLYMDGTPSAGSTPSKFVISTTASGTTNQAEVVTIDSDGNMGIGVPDPQAKLDVNGNLRISDGNQGNGKILTSDSNGFASWQAPAAVTQGDVKHGFQSGDHNGWYLLDGRAISTLSANAQAAAISLGFSSNLPNATNRVLKANSGVETLGAQAGSNTLTLNSNNIPQLLGTTNSTGDHNHGFNDTRTEFASASVRSGNNYPSFPYATNYTDDSESTQNSGNHSHTVTIGNSSPTSLNITPSSIVTNVFIYLGL